MSSLTNSHLSKRDYTDGYPSLAAFMASDRDKTTLIFKRFNRLSARNLLYLGSELAELQAKLDAYDEQDRVDADSLQCARNWESFKKRAQSQPERMQLVKQVRDTMKEYKEALAYESILAGQPSPDRNTLKPFIHNFFHGRPGEDDSFPTLGGASKHLYDDPNDLLVLRDKEEADRLSNFIQSNFGYLFREKNPTGASGVSQVGYASGDQMYTFISYLSTIFASLLLIISIVILYKIRSPDLKLGLISLFTVTFAASIGILTNAKRVEMFGATAAYAAVLVVFVSGDLGGKS